jgi:hypothetical protein
VSYFDGRWAALIEGADSVFNVVDLSMRAIFDFGIAQLDYTGAVKSTAS